MVEKLIGSKNTTKIDKKCPMRMEQCCDFKEEKVLSLDWKLRRGL
jgi:hypothetical protein